MFLVEVSYFLDKHDGMALSNTDPLLINNAAVSIFNICHNIVPGSNNNSYSFKFFLLTNKPYSKFTDKKNTRSIKTQK